VEKLKLALYWAASCGGCEIAVLDLGERILDLAAIADIVFWPVALDFKYRDVETLPDNSIDVCLFNGGVRTSENEHMARLLRAKSKVLVAFGSCAHLGGIPGLANVTNRAGVFDVVYRDTASTVNGDGLQPQPVCQVPEGELRIPRFYNSVRPLGQVVPVDYYQPGCPPDTEQIWNVVQAIAGARLPTPGSVVGASDRTLCDECDRIKEEKKVKQFYHISEIVPDPKRCLLEQGVVCCGPATRGGCGQRCLNANMPCRGCYGPAPGVADQGAKLISAISSVLDSEDPREIDRTLSKIGDPLGTFYRFSFPSSLMARARVQEPPMVAAPSSLMAGARVSQP